MREIFIEPQKEGKGRTFQAICLATVEADSLWAGGASSEDQRPIWAMFAGSENELRPFIVNLTMGRKAEFAKTGYSRRGAERLEVLKSARFQTTWQREAEGCIVTVFLPDLFRLDPGLVEVDGIKFVMLPSRRFLDGQKVNAEPIAAYGQKYAAKHLSQQFTDEEMAAMVPMAYLFTAYLDRRTRCPLLADGRFYLQLMLACLQEGLASWGYESDYGTVPWGTHRGFRFQEIDTRTVGLVPGIAFLSTHAKFEEILAREVTLFFQGTR